MASHVPGSGSGSGPGVTTVSLVTGGNRGIGREVCRQLAGLGHAVVLTARSADGAAAAARAAGAEPLRLDVTEPASVAAAAKWVSDRYGKLDVLVNNAAISYDTWQRAANADLAVVREAAETNLYGPWLMVEEFLPLLRRGDHPRIVNVSSEAASLASMGGGTPAYSASKVALNALTKMLAAELRRDGILVNAVCPGWVATDMGGPGGRPVSDGAASVVWAAVLPDSGPTGGCFRDGRPLPWSRARPEAVGDHVEDPLLAGLVARRVARGDDSSLEHRDEIVDVDVAADRASVLSTAQQFAERGLQRVLQRAGDGDGVGQVALGGGLVRDPAEEPEERRARVGGPGAGAHVRDEVFEPGRDHRLEQRLLGGEVPVHGARPDARRGGDLVERHAVPGRGEGVPGRAQDLLPVAAGVSAQRPVSHPVSHPVRHGC